MSLKYIQVELLKSSISFLELTAKNHKHKSPLTYSFRLVILQFTGLLSVQARDRLVQDQEYL